MPNYTENLHLVKPLQSEQYNIDVFNSNADKIDQFAGQVPARALTADKLTTGAKINGVNFKGDTDIVTGAGFYYNTVTYSEGDLAFIYNQNDGLELHKSTQDGNIGHNPLTSTGYWEEVKLGGGSGYNLFDLKYSDHILEGNGAKGFERLGLYVYKTAVAGSRYGYPDFYNKCVEEKIAGTETTITVGDYSFTGYKNANGHIFFDIADKDTVDNIYTSTGKAWYYGIDTANERIFLPRVKNALVGMTDIANTSAVVPNTTNPMPQFTVHNDLDAVGNLHTYSVSGHPYNQVHWNGRQGNNNGNLLWTTKGNTGLLSDNANVKSALNNDNFYIYMCVGNTEQESAVTDVIDITTSENDTIPLGWSTYQSGVTPSSAFLASLGQQNSGTLYPTFYNKFSAKIGQAFGAGFVKAHTASDITDYDLVINQDEQTFRLPLKNGKENLVGNEYIQINTLPANDTTLTAPANGYYTISVWASATTSRFYMTNLSNNLTVGEAGANLSNTYWNYVMPCKKGDKIQFHYESIAIQDGNFYFCPNIGNGTLYYKVSNAVQNLQLLDVAEMTTALANKQDKCIHIIDTYVNGTSGYRIWSDGYCEQWAHKDNWGDISSFTFLKTFKDTNYIVVFNGRKDDSTSNLGITTITTTTINYNNSDTSLNGDLLAKGYLARGEY